ncbi:LAME_0B02366g1_1 [Lachancea meyersii CBS 8951]|uniref:LAME_0B02366g1_1 n=1 Tax=Lachancea meyersii CBS 8951 TaxID=1266667 RepID=A0A1G4ITI8_9SACH|nr:LAME_0B02366g1_1 [Lachancea meyersii CBS 8951]
MFTRKLLPVGNTLLEKASLPVSKASITLLTYNMLSPYYMWPQVYTYVPEQYKDWSYRHRLLEREILSLYRADIMCLQEMTQKDYKGFWKTHCKEKMNYGSSYIAKTPPAYWKRTSDEMDGVGIFYNLDKFQHISTNSIYLNDLIGLFNINELNYLKSTIITLTNGAGEPIAKDSLLNVLHGRNQVSLFVSLMHRETRTLFVVINTHLYWKYDEVKLCQCLTIMRKLHRVIKQLLVGRDGATYSRVKILFAGDLNSSPDSPVVKFLKGESVHRSDLSLINPLRPYLNHYIYQDTSAELFEHTCYSGKLKGIFDYIWYHDSDFRLKRILSGAEVSQELRQMKEFGLPNKGHPSDHIPVLTELELLD